MKFRILIAFWLGGWFTFWALGIGAATTVGTSLLSKKKSAGGVAYNPVDLTSEQTKSVQGNLGNEGGIEALLSRANAFNQSQATSLQEKAMPGYTELAKSLTGQAQKLADNPYSVPADVQANLSRIAAEKGISAGTRGQFNDFSLLRDLGVNELQYGQAALSTSEGIARTLASIAPKVNPMSPLSFYTTPAQAVGTATTNNTYQQEIAQGAANANTAAQNANSADLWGSLLKLSGSFISDQQKPGGLFSPKKNSGGGTDFSGDYSLSPNSDSGIPGFG